MMEKQIRNYYTKLMQEQLGELDSDDREVLESTIEFEIVSDKIRRFL